MKHEVVSEEQWIEARRALLAEEKAFTRERGVSVFYMDDDGMMGDHGTIYHTYSTYGRGGEMFLPVYSWLDVVPKGRNETKNGNLSDWMRRHDRYENDGRTRQANPETADAS